MREHFDEQDITEEAEVTTAQDTAAAEKKPSVLRQQLLLFIQLGVCTAVLAAAFIIRAAGGTLYAETAGYYFDSYNDTIFTTSRSEPLFFTDNTSISETSRRNYSETGSLSDEAIRERIILPVKAGRIITSFTEQNKGIDISTDKGSDIYAVLDGRVSVVGKNDSLGSYLVLDHGSGIQTLYAHCGEISVKKGTDVSSGDKLAAAGSSGEDGNACLHFELIKNGTAADPSEYFKGAYE